MDKVGRNAPCLCMSGKKYKSCCDKTGFWNLAKENGMTYYDEDFALKELLSTDKRFQKLYSDERDKIRKPVLFFQSNHLQSEASFGNIGEDSYGIITKHPQIPIKDSIHIAHEIEHLVLCSEGHKIVKTNEVIGIAKNINDMIYDPILNKRLISYGYNLESYLNLSDDIQIGNIGDNTNNSGQLFLTLTLYVKRILDYRNLYPNIKEEEITFNQWVHKNYPQLVPHSKSLLKIVEENGVGNPSETEVTLLKIIDYLELGEQYKVVNL